MPSRTFSRSLLLDTCETARDLLTLINDHQQVPTVGIHPPSQLHLPDLRISTQHFIDLGLLPAAAERLLIYFLKPVAQYRQILENSFSRAIQLGCHLPLAYYHDTFVVLYERAIQSWESQVVSAVQVPLSYAGSPLRTKCIDIRVDDVMKVEILSRLGLKTLLTPQYSTDIRCIMKTAPQLGKVDEKEKVPHPKLAKPCIPSEEITPKYRNFFSSTSSSCFPTRYPPLHGLSSPPIPIATSFTPKPLTHNTKPTADSHVDVPSLANCFTRMAVTGLNVYPEIHGSGSHKASWTPSPKTKPLSPLLSPVNAGPTSSASEPWMKTTDSPAKITTSPRKRKIAGLPTRRTKAPTSSTSNVLPPLRDATSPNDIILYSSARPTAKAVVPKEASPTMAYFESPARARLTKTSSSPPLTQRKSIPPRKMTSLPQAAAPSSCQVLMHTQVGRDAGLQIVSRVPSLVSDASSLGDSPSSSSDELDTPPSTPPSFPQMLSVSRHASAEGATTLSQSKLAIRNSPLLEGARARSPRQGSIRVDFTKCSTGGIESSLSFTFTA